MEHWPVEVTVFCVCAHQLGPCWFHAVLAPDSGRLQQLVLDWVDPSAVDGCSIGTGAWEVEYSPSLFVLVVIINAVADGTDAPHVKRCHQLG
jgi:hypothetical protein